MEDLFSDTEKIFIIDGIQHSIRIDGRELSDYRQMVLETNVSPNCSGSAHLRLANNDVLVGVKLDLEEPSEDKPDEGKVEFFVDCTANAAPQFEGRGGERLSGKIRNMLIKAYDQASSLDRKSLCVVPNAKVWILYVDVLILECGGSLMDAASIAVKAALYDTKIPSLTVHKVEGNIEIDVTDDPFDFKRLDVSNAPCLVTLSKIGAHFVVDTCQEEEQCALAKLVLAVDGGGRIISTHSEGAGLLHRDSVLDILQFSANIGISLNKAIMEALETESKMVAADPKKKLDRGLFD